MNRAIEANRDFLNLFWDLASDDAEKRIPAGNKIVELTMNPREEQSGIDKSYTVKRLVKGLSSSRDSARLGFAGCLSELLRVDNGVDRISTSEVLSILDSSTQITGSLKGADEREFMFGKLFACICIIRSGRLYEDLDSTRSVLTRLRDLYFHRLWIREAVGEAVALLIGGSDGSRYFVSASIVAQLSDLLSPMLQPLNTASLPSSVSFLSLAVAQSKAASDANRSWIESDQYSSLSPAQLSLLASLQLAQAQRVQEFSEENWLSGLPADDVFTAERLANLIPALMDSTAGYPKINRLWDMIIGAVFGWSEFGVTSTERASSLSNSANALLVALINVLNNNLLQASHEKKSVAFHIFVEILRRVPHKHLSRTLNLSVVLRNLLLARINPKHTLNRLAGVTLSAFCSAAGDDTKLRVFLANSMITVGGSNFDSRTGTKSVSQLLHGLDRAGVEKFIENISSSYITSLVSGRVQSVPSEENGESENPAASGATNAELIGSLDMLYTLGKNSSLQARDSTVSSLCALLFATGYLNLKSLSISSAEIQLKAILESVQACLGSATSPTEESTVDKKKSSKKSKKDVKASQAQETIGGLQRTMLETIYRVLTSLLVRIQQHAELVQQQQDLVSVSKSSSKKGSKKRGLDETLAVAGSAVSDLVPVRLSRSVILHARRTLVSVLSEHGFASLAELQSVQPSGDKKGQANESNESGAVAAEKVSLLDECVEVFRKLAISFESPILLTITQPETRNRDEVEDSDGDDDLEVDDAVEMRLKIAKHIATAQSISATLKTAQTDSEGNKHFKFLEHLKSFVGFVFFQSFATTLVEGELVDDLSKVVNSILSGKDTIEAGDRNEEDDEDEDDEDDDEESVQAVLVDVCLDLLGACSEFGARGLRDVIRGLWMALSADVGVRDEAVLAVVDAVIKGSEKDGDDEEDGGEEDGEDGEDEEEGDDSDEHTKSSKPAVHASKEISSAKSKQPESQAKGEDAPQKDVLVTPAQLMKLLAGSSKHNSDESSNESDDNDDNDTDNDESSDILDDELDAEALKREDKALRHMLKLKAEARKSGILVALRQQTIFKTRCLDILEMLLARCDSSNVLLYSISKCLVAYRVAATSKQLQSFTEGVAFAQRLKQLLDNKLGTKKFRVFNSEDEEDEAEEDHALVDLQDSVQTAITHLKHSLPPIRQTALVCLIAIVRACMHLTSGDRTKRAEVVRGLLSELAVGILAELVNKKHSRYTIHIITELVNRFPGSFFPSHLMQRLVLGLEKSTNFFMQVQCAELAVVSLKRLSAPDSLESSQEVITGHVTALVESMGRVLKNSLGDADDSSSPLGKRSREFVIIVKDAVSIIKNIVVSPSAEHSVASLLGTDKSISKAFHGALLVAKEGLSVALKRAETIPTVLKAIKSAEEQLDAMIEFVSSKVSTAEPAAEMTKTAKSKLKATKRKGYQEKDEAEEEKREEALLKKRSALLKSSSSAAGAAVVSEQQSSTIGKGSERWFDDSSKESKPSSSKRKKTSTA